MPINSSIQNVDLSKLKLNQFTWAKILKDLPYHDISHNDFVQVAVHSPGFKLASIQGKPFQITENQVNVDSWVKEALWNFDSDLYDTLRGSTKSARLGRTYHGLLKYCGPVVYKRQLFDYEFNDIYEDEINKLGNQFKNFSPLSLDEACDKMNLDGAAGYNYPGKKKGDVIHDARRTVKKYIELFKQGRKPDHIPYKLGQRGHLSPVNELKSRAIWMGPIETNIMENMLFRPFYDQIFSTLHLSDTILSGDKAMARLHTYLSRDTDQTFVNTDISGWDSLRCRFLLKDIFFRVLKPCIKFEFAWQENMFEWLVEDFIYSMLALPGGIIIQKDCGIPTGSFLTMLVNSLANILSQCSCLRYLKIQFYHKRVLGDDFSFFMDRLDESQFNDVVKSISDAMFTFFKLVVKPEKVIVTNSVHDRKFIGYQIRYGRLYREDGELFRGVLYPENCVKSLSVSFTRMFAFYVLGGCNSVKFSSFYAYFLSGYYKALVDYGDGLFNLKVLRSGNLRVFKHVFHLDLRPLEAFDINRFRSLFSSKVPFCLTLGMDFML